MRCCDTHARSCTPLWSGRAYATALGVGSTRLTGTADMIMKIHLLPVCMYHTETRLTPAPLYSRIFHAVHGETLLRDNNRTRTLALERI